MAGGAAAPGMFAQAVAEEEEKRRQYGQFTGYQPVPGTPGAYNFNLAGGGQRQFVGPAAEQLRGQIDQAQRGPANDWLPYKTGEGGNQVLLRKGGDPSNPLDLREVVAPRRATKGGLVETGRTIEGGYELNPERMAQIEESKKSEFEIQKQAAARAQVLSAERQAAFEAMRTQQVAEANQIAKDQADKERALGDMRAKYDKAEAAFTGFGAEQERKENSAQGRLKTFVHALAQAAGAFGAGMARTPNFAMQAIEAHNEREMRKQEAELRIRKDAKDNLLGQLKEQMGSIDLAKSAFRAIQSKQTMLTLEQLAAKAQDAQEQTSLLGGAAKAQTNYLMWKEELERKGQGEVTRSLRNMPGQAASPGGVRSVQGRDVDKRDPNSPNQAKLSDTAANNLANIRSAKELLPGVAESSRQAGTILTTGILGSDESQNYAAKANSLIRIAAKAVEGDSAAESHVEQLQEDLLSSSENKRKAAQIELMRTLSQKEQEMLKVVPGAQGLPR